MACADDAIFVEVVRCDRAGAHRRRVRLLPGATVADAISASGIALPPAGAQDGPPRIDAGVFGRPMRLDDPVCNGDRVELYRPLGVDPKEARRLRAARRAGDGTGTEAPGSRGRGGKS